MRRFAFLIVICLTAAIAQPARASSHFTKLTDVRLEMSDGVTLAADVYIPTTGDADGDGRYPCVAELTPYRKENRAAEGVSYLPGAGVALIEIDARGTGGSEGEYDIVFSVREQADVVEWIDWAATEATKPDGSTLCEETVGMYGGSYSGIIQYLVATLPLEPGDEGFGRLPTGTTHLAAIAPQRAYGDLYRDIVYHGGMLIGSFGAVWSGGTTGLYTQPPSDVNTPAGQAAWMDHLSKNDPMMRNYIENPYPEATWSSDDAAVPYSQRLYEDSSALPRVANMRAPTLHLAGWFDTFTRGQLQMFREAYGFERALGGRGPNYLIVGPWNHTNTHFITPAHFTDRLGDWYRYWLEGRANGAPEPAWFSEPRAKYFQMVSGKLNAESPADGEWRLAADWPPPLSVRKLWLSPLGRLADAQPTEAWEAYSGYDAYMYDPASGTTEFPSRWDNAAHGAVPHAQLDQRAETGRALSYESDPLPSDVAIAGPFSIRLVVSINTAGFFGCCRPPTYPSNVDALEPEHIDADLIVKVSDMAPITEGGVATQVTAGYLRASHRRLDYSKSLQIDGELLQPYHPHTRATVDTAVAGLGPFGFSPVEIEIWPTAKTFKAGHRIRIDVASADTPNHLTLLKPGTVLIGRNRSLDSYLRLPVVP